MWDVLITKGAMATPEDQLRTVLTRAVARRLPRNKKLVRVVAWSQNAGCLFAPKAGERRYAVAYEVRSTA